MAEVGTKLIIENDRGGVDWGRAGHTHADRNVGAVRYHKVFVELKAPE
jgi:hypothetical protein